VRLGVAPDHQKIKFVTNVFDKVAANPRFRFFGGVEFGKDVTLADLKAYYHQIVYCTGAQTDRRMGIPGEDLSGSHPATEFVAWYNGHPDYRDCTFDLTQERVAVVGVGNVAVDVVRILCRTPEELATTDIADYALEALRLSRVKEVYLLGRRGPAQAAFTNPEVRGARRAGRRRRDRASGRGRARPAEPRGGRAQPGSGHAEEGRDPQGVCAAAVHGQVAPAHLAIHGLAGRADRRRRRQRDGAQARAQRALRDLDGRAPAARHGPLRESAGRSRLPLGRLPRCPAAGVPFNESWGVILNDKGRVLDSDTKQPIVGEYAAGWIKRGPTGVIGTNKPDAAETVECMFEDLAAGSVLEPAHPEAAAAEALVRQRQPSYFSYADWQKLDAIEVERGRAQAAHASSSPASKKCSPPSAADRRATRRSADDLSLVRGPFDE
jgi:ferredoxin--NADP+ reductase